MGDDSVFPMDVIILMVKAVFWCESGFSDYCYVNLVILKKFLEFWFFVLNPGAFHNMTLRELLMARFKFFHYHHCSLDPFEVCGTFSVVLSDKVEYFKKCVQIRVFHFTESTTNCVTGV